MERGRKCELVTGAEPYMGIVFDLEFNISNRSLHDRWIVQWERMVQGRLLCFKTRTKLSGTSRSIYFIHCGFIMLALPSSCLANFAMSQGGQELGGTVCIFVDTLVGTCCITRVWQYSGNIVVHWCENFTIERKQLN